MMVILWAWTLSRGQAGTPRYSRVLSRTNTAVSSSVQRTPLLDPRQRFELVERRWGRQRPFERRCAYAPRVGRRLTLSGEGISNADEKHDQANPRDVRPDR